MDFLMIMERLYNWISTITQNEVILWASFISIWIVAGIFIKLIRQTHDSRTIDWTGLVTAKGTSSVSLTKLIQLVGSVVGSWIVIKMTLQEKITWDIFSIYLAYTASVEGFSKFLSAKYGSNKSVPQEEVKTDKHVSKNVKN
jgi:high-affinity Fe2+/Pb2+ permease